MSMEFTLSLDAFITRHGDEDARAFERCSEGKGDKEREGENEDDETASPKRSSVERRGMWVICLVMIGFDESTSVETISEMIRSRVREARRLSTVYALLFHGTKHAIMGCTPSLMGILISLLSSVHDITLCASFLNQETRYRELGNTLPRAMLHVTTS
eukprot:1352305-Amorphochlora_amoeboformis.AAC.1